MHFRKELKSWSRVEEDMRAAGYPESQIQKAKESYYQCMDLLRKVLQRMLLSSDMVKNGMDARNEDHV